MKKLMAWVLSVIVALIGVGFSVAHAAPPEGQKVDVAFLEPAEEIEGNRRSYPKAPGQGAAVSLVAGDGTVYKLERESVDDHAFHSDGRIPAGEYTLEVVYPEGTRFVEGFTSNDIPEPFTENGATITVKNAYPVLNIYVGIEDIPATPDVDEPDVDVPDVDEPEVDEPEVEESSKPVIAPETGL